MSQHRGGRRTDMLNEAKQNLLSMGVEEVMVDLGIQRVQHQGYRPTNASQLVTCVIHELAEIEKEQAPQQDAPKPPAPAGQDPAPAAGSEVLPAGSEAAGVRPHGGAGVDRPAGAGVGGVEIDVDAGVADDSREEQVVIRAGSEDKPPPYDQASEMDVDDPPEREQPAGAGAPAGAPAGAEADQEPQDMDADDDEDEDRNPLWNFFLSKDDLRALKPTDQVDHRDSVGRFVMATIKEVNHTNLKIHYVGWADKWDCWCDYAQYPRRFAYTGTISQRASEKFAHLKPGDFVDINPNRHPGWRFGEIRRLDQHSGQVQVVYEYSGKHCLYWSHLDNSDEIAEFRSKSSQPASSAKKDYHSQRERPDEMGTWVRIRAKRFPRKDGEVINNPYTVGDWLELKSHSGWLTASVVDKEHNWIMLRLDGWSQHWDERVHVVDEKHRLRALGSGLAPDQVEIDIQQEMEQFSEAVQKMSCQILPIDADGNCLYRCFAFEIYGNADEHMTVRNECCDYMVENREFFEAFIPEFDEAMAIKRRQFEWGDHVDIISMSECYNVRVRVLELNQIEQKCILTFESGDQDEAVGLPVIQLARHRQKHYNVIDDPEAVMQRPHKKPADRVNETVSLRAMRLSADEQAKRAIEEKKEEKGDEEADNGVPRSNSIQSSFDLHISLEEFSNLLQEDYRDERRIPQATLRTAAFVPLMKLVYKKVQHQWEQKYSNINFHDNFGTWYNEKIGNGTFWTLFSRKVAEGSPGQDMIDVETCLTKFEETVTGSIAGVIPKLLRASQNSSRDEAEPMDEDYVVMEKSHYQS